MKRTINYLIALAITAFTFTSCEDVPSPFGNILPPDNGEKVVVEPTGSGTAADPYNVAAVLEFVSGLGADTQSSNQVYIKGIVSEVQDVDVSGTYGNATYYISDDADGKANKFMIYRGFGLGGKKFNEGATPVKAGDNVIIKSKVVNYKGNTPETVSNDCIIVELNGDKAEDTPQPAGDVKTVTVAQFIAAPESATQWYQLTGTVKNLKDGDQYGNFDLEDATGSVYVYGLLAEQGGESKKFQELVAAKGIKNGCKLTINGLRSSYNGNVQVKSAYFVKVEAGEGGDTPVGGGDGTENNPYNVAGAQAKAEQTGVYLKGFIVGFVDGQAYESGATFSSAATGATNILLAASADETDAKNCMPIQLPSGAIRTLLNLQDNPGNYKKEVLLYGDIATYFKVAGFKNTSYAVIDGKSAGTKPGGGSGGGGDDTGGVKTVSVADFIAAPESTDVWYQITGTVKNLKDNDQYGNFDIVDETGTVYVYGLLSEKGGEKKKFQELVAAKGIENGSKITIIGNRGSYNGKVEVLNAYFVSIDNSGSGSGGGSAATGADGSTIISVVDFNAAPESTDVWYQLTGTVKNLKDNDQYGNFDLEDSTGSVYVYGVLSEKGGAKKQFQDLAKAKGITNGKKITIVGNRGSYNGKIEVLNAYFIKVE